MFNATLLLDSSQLYLDSLCVFAKPFGNLGKCKSLKVEVSNLTLTLGELDH